MTWLIELVPTIVGIALLLAITTAVALGFRVRHPYAMTFAVLRGAAQLAAISLVLSGIIADPLWVAAGLAVMFAAAVATSTRRIGFSSRHLGEVAAAMAAGTAATLVVVFGSGAIEFSPRYVLAISGIVIGNAMSIATLTGKRFSEAVFENWGEVEGWLALGATPRRSTREFTRRAVRFALIPSIDQTKTTGLVTLPGAFVGAIFGGASPLEAGRFQIVVLAGILCAGMIVAATLAWFLAPVERKPELTR
ncbi:ABC transporter permease [Luethyella okanaganae]|uniref:ABC transporter permease n=1 Tax=Luethyella okanaganae TaxID=69372 RepID=A0ABW1VGN3_9MICO